MGTASLAHAQYWVVPTGDWSNPTNWNSAHDGSGTSGVPAYYATVDNNGTCTIAATDGAIYAGNLFLGDANGNGAST